MSSNRFQMFFYVDDVTTLTVTLASCLFLSAAIAIRWWCTTGNGIARRSVETVSVLRDDEIEASRLPLPPGSLGFPVLGEMAQFIVEAPSGEFFTKRERLYGPVFKTHILGRPTVYVAGPDAIRKILLGEHTLVETAWPPSMSYLLGPGALSSLNGDHHRLQKRRTMVCLARERCLLYASLMRTIIREELDSWKQPVDVYAVAKRLTTRAAARILFGIDLQQDTGVSSSSSSDGATAADSSAIPVGSDIARDLEYFGAGFFAVPVPVPGTAFYKAILAKRRLCRTLAAILKSNECSKRDDVMTDLFIGGDTMTSQETVPDDRSKSMSAINQALELLFGGQETLSGVITCLLMLMAPQRTGNEKGETDKGPEQLVFDKMADEVNRMCFRDGRELDCDAVVGGLKYVDAVIKETLRLWPPIGGGYRRARRTFDVAGYQIPRGWAVTYSIRGTHDRSQIFSDDANDFNPGRWMSPLVEHEQSVDSLSTSTCGFNFVPFGAGARACVGRQYAMMFARTFCVELARNFRGWRVREALPVPMLTVPIVRPRDPMHAVFERR